MTAAASRLETVARAICTASGANPDTPIYRNGSPKSGVLYYKWALYREEAEAAIAACHAEELVAAMRELLEAADESITSTDDVAAMLRFGKANKDARALLVKLDGKP